MYKKIIDYVTLIFSLVWIVLIFLDYWYFHQLGYFQSIKNFQYLDLTILLGLLGGGSYFLLTKLHTSNKPFLLCNGLGIILLFFVISTCIISRHIAKLNIGIQFTSIDIFHFLGNLLLILLGTYFIVLCCYVLGNFVIQKLFSFTFDKLSDMLVRLALGMILLTLMLFLLGAVHLLRNIVLWPLLLLIVGVFWKDALVFLKRTFIKPIAVEHELNWIGFASFYISLVFVSLVYIQNIRPFPYGFDALAVYLNIPNLISENNSLIIGYSPYYWSLFVSLGHILFNKLSMVISLSVLGSILSGVSIYAICSKWIDSNYALFTCLLFFTLPLVNYQSFKDVKTDLGLLFIMLTVIITFIKYLELLYPDDFNRKLAKVVKRTNTKRRKQKLIKVEKKVVIANIGSLSKFITKEQEILVLLGILSGMVLGIKLTGLILVFSLISTFSYLKTGGIGFLSSTFFFVFLILAGGLDVASGLRAYHFGATYMMWISLVLFIVGFVLIWLQNRKRLFELLRTISIYSFFLLLIYLPWPIKNYVETGVISINTFIEGKAVGPSKNVDAFFK